MLLSVKIVGLESLELELGELCFIIWDVDIAESLYCVTVTILGRVTRDNSQTINAVSSDSESVVTKVLAWLTFYQTNPWIFCDIFGPPLTISLLDCLFIRTALLRSLLDCRLMTPPRRRSLLEVLLGTTLLLGSLTDTLAPFSLPRSIRSSL